MDTLTTNGASILAQGEFEYWITTENALLFKAETPQKAWEDITSQLFGISHGLEKTYTRSMLMLGDALRFGESAYGEEYAQAIDGARHALSSKTLENLASIAARIAPAQRHEQLSIGHHDAVARLTPEEQQKYLDTAQDSNLTVPELRKAVKTAHPPKRKSPVNGKKKAAKKLVVDVTDEEGMMHLADTLATHLTSRAPETHDRWAKHLCNIVAAVSESDSEALVLAFCEAAGAFFERNKLDTPEKGWSAARKAAWTEPLNNLAKAGRRMGVIGSAKPRKGAE